MNSLKESKQLREIIKREALKMFNKDYDVLYYLIKDMRIEGGKTVDDLISKHIGGKDILDKVLLENPTLTIFVPELPMESFSAERWDINEIPAIAVKTNQFNDIPLITPEGEKEVMPAENIPGFPVLVIKDNERIVSSVKSSNIGRFKGQIIYDKELILRFLDDAFNPGVIIPSNPARTTTVNDSKVTSAYNIYNVNNPQINGWHRDYIYYNIKPNTPNGPFSYKYKEYLGTIEAEGNAKQVYTRMSDQSGDPYINEHLSGDTTFTNWTDGQYDLSFAFLINGKNGVGESLTIMRSVAPTDLFVLEYRHYTKGHAFWKKNYYDLVSVKSKPYLVDTEVFNWDLEAYSASIRAEIEEIDNPETVTVTKTLTSEFATNFGVDASFGNENVKVGLKFGMSTKDTSTQTNSVVATKISDKLGQAIINFQDNVVIGKTGSNWNYRTYSTGTFRFNFQPVRVQ